MGKKKLIPAVGRKNPGSNKRSRPQTRSPYIYHWYRIIGALAAVLLLIGLAAYGIHTLSPSVDPEQIEPADRMPTRTPSNEKMLAVNIEDKLDPAHVTSETVTPPASPESAEKPAPPQPKENEQPAATVEELAQTTDVAVEDQEIKQSVERGVQRTTQSPSKEKQLGADMKSEAESADVAAEMTEPPAPPESIEKPATPQPEEDEQPAATVEELAQTTDVAVESQEIKRSVQRGDQEATQSRHGDAGMPRVLEFEDNKPAFSLIATKSSSPAVKQFELATSVENRKPIGDLGAIRPDSRGLAVVYAFSDIVGMRGHSVYYHWMLNGRQVARVRVAIGADRWRSYSSKTINKSMKGTWRVELHDPQGQVLASADFSYSTNAE